MSHPAGDTEFSMKGLQQAYSKDWPQKTLGRERPEHELPGSLLHFEKGLLEGVRTIQRKSRAEDTSVTI